MASGVDGSIDIERKRERERGERDERYAVRSAGGPIQVRNMDKLLHTIKLGDPKITLENLDFKDLSNLRKTSRFGRDYMDRIGLLEGSRIL